MPMRKILIAVRKILIGMRKILIPMRKDSYCDESKVRLECCIIVFIVNRFYLYRTE